MTRAKKKKQYQSRGKRIFFHFLTHGVFEENLALEMLVLPLNTHFISIFFFLEQSQSIIFQ